MLPVSLFSNGEMGIRVAAGAEFPFSCVSLFFKSLGHFQLNLCYSEACQTVNDGNGFLGIFLCFLK